MKNLVLALDLPEAAAVALYEQCLGEPRRHAAVLGKLEEYMAERQAFYKAAKAPAPVEVAKPMAPLAKKVAPKKAAPALEASEATPRRATPRRRTPRRG